MLCTLVCLMKHKQFVNLGCVCTVVGVLKIIFCFNEMKIKYDEHVPLVNIYITSQVLKLFQTIKFILENCQEANKCLV